MSQVTSLQQAISEELAGLRPPQLRKVREYVRLLKLSPLIGKVDPEQAYFWTPAWQEMERAAEADLEAGRVHEYASVEELRCKIEKTG